MLQENWNYRKYEHEYSCVELPHKVHKFNINHELSIPQAREQLKGNIDIGISPTKEFRLPRPNISNISSTHTFKQRPSEAEHPFCRHHCYY